MLDVIKQLLDKDLVTEDTRVAIEEAWESKLAEVKEEAKTEVREEFAKRYEHDKSQMVEAMDRMMTEGLQKEIAEFVEDRKQLAAERVNYKTSIAPHKEMLTKFVKESLAKENNYYMWLKAIFGGLLFIGSTTSIYFLMKYRKNFMYSK